MNNEVFEISSDFSRSVFPRYRVILLARGRYVLFLLPLFLWTSSFIIIDPEFFVIDASSISPSEHFLRLLFPYLSLLASLVLLLLLRPLSEKWFERSKLKELSDKSLKSRRTLVKVDPSKCETWLPIINRTYYRYCASLKMREKEMVIEDKIVGLVNGRLRLKDVGETHGRGIVRFNLSINNITTMWIARDLIVMRFCWGDTYLHVWDVIVDRSRFVEGTDKDFISYMKRFLEYRQIVYDKADFERFKGKVQLGNKCTNRNGGFYFFGLPCQQTVKIYNVHWGPFRRRKKEHDQQGDSDE